MYKAFQGEQLKWKPNLFRYMHCLPDAMVSGSAEHLQEELCILQVYKDACNEIFSLILC